MKVKTNGTATATSDAIIYAIQYLGWIARNAGSPPIPIEFASTPVDIETIDAVAEPINAA